MEMFMYHIATSSVRCGIYYIFKKDYKKYILLTKNSMTGLKAWYYVLINKTDNLKDKA